jgi:hypothetical protein
MKKDGTGGANTQTGIQFEKNTDFIEFLNTIAGYTSTKIPNYNDSYFVYYNNLLVARTFPKYDLYKFLEREYNLNWQEILSKRLLPDDAIYVIKDNTVHIAGSVDEKLQTCDFKKKHYQKLFSRINYSVEYLYILEKAWFGDPKYRDTLDYIIDMGCKWYFNYLPLQEINLPVPRDV